MYICLLSKAANTFYILINDITGIVLYVLLAVLIFLMNLLPLTDLYLTQLLKEGYTHIVLKRIIDPADREINSTREMHIYEAYPEGHPMLQKFISEEITSDSVMNLRHTNQVDVYIVKSDEY